MQNPGMAQQMVNLQHSAAQATPEQREKLATLKADPELKLIFDDIEQNGPSEAFACSQTLILVCICVHNRICPGQIMYQTCVLKVGRGIRFRGV